MIPYPPKPTGELDPRPVLRLVLGMACYADDKAGLYTFFDLLRTIITVLFLSPKALAFSLSLRTFPLNTNLMLSGS